MSQNPAEAEQSGVARFFDSRAAYMLFSTATNEKPVVAARIGAELEQIGPGPHALRILDAGMGDATVLTQLMRRAHQGFTHVPWLIVGKEISIEDVRLSLDKLADRFYEHPEMVFVVTNMYHREAPHLIPSREEALADLSWRTIPLEGSTAYEFSRQIRSLYPTLVDDWAVRTSPRTGNPLYVRPSVLVLYRQDREFILDSVIPKPGAAERRYDLIIASQPYRARTSVEHKMRTVIVPLARALAPGGRLVVVHAHGDDPGLEIVRGVWPDEDPFQTDRHVLAEAAKDHFTEPGDHELRLEPLSDEEAIFRYHLHAMASEVQEHIGTSLIVAAWNAATYVAQIDEERLAEAISSGRYIPATREVIRKHQGVWFNDEVLVVSRVPKPPS
ncbi:MAG: hypothetical protein KY394_07400 [Actinobacteria bacterium]|nr:hypothetical protein [Actinomycetota bacterium]